MLNTRTTLLLTVLLALLFSGCVANTPNSGHSVPADDRTLKVGITTNAPPMAYRAQGKITGLEAEFAHGLAQFTGRKLRFVELKWEDQIPALLSGRTDIIMSAMTITDARKYRINFSDPYLATGQVPLVRLSEVNRFSDGFPALLNPVVRVGVVRATTGELLLVKNKAKGGIFRFDTPLEGVKALEKNEIDAFVYDLPMNFYFAAEYADQGIAPVVTLMTREFLAWGVRKNDPELLSQANAYLAQLKSSGELKKKVVHWIPFYAQIYNHQ